jgi:hypothetical protein
VTSLDELREALRGPEPKLALSFANIRCFWGIEANKPDIRLHVEDVDGITIDYRDICGLDWFGSWFNGRNCEQRDSG